MSLPKIPNLIFSTRTANPESGVEFHREVVAESPGVPKEARSLFARCADITLTARKRDQPAIIIFRQVRPGMWLFCRVISLGLYRKGSHHLLAHGLVLNQAHLDAVEGNPLLLLRMADFFIDKHPGGKRTLPELVLPETKFRSAREQNITRLEALAGQLGAEPGFGPLFDGAREGRPVTCEAEQSSTDWIEWVLLHLHPYDRVEVGFHSWAIEESDGDYNLAVVPPGTTRRGKRVEPGSRVAQASNTLRHRIGVAGYRKALDTFHLTYRSRRGGAAPLDDEEEILVALRNGPINPLDRKSLRPDMPPRELKTLKKLFFRGLGQPAEAARFLAEVWRKEGFSSYREQVEELVETYPEITSKQLGILRPLVGGDIETIWSALELVRRRRGESIENSRLQALWRVLVPAERSAELFERFPDKMAADAVQEVLAFYVDHSVERHFESARGAASRLAEVPYWPAWERWRFHQGQPVAEALGRMEQRVKKHSGDPAVAAQRFRELAELAERREVPMHAYRLSFMEELPALGRVGSVQQRERLHELVWKLVGGSGGAASEYLKAARFFLNNPQEFLEAGNADALPYTILWTLVSLKRSGNPDSCAETLQRLQQLDSGHFDPKHFSRLSFLGAWSFDWSELLFDELLESPPLASRETRRFGFACCLCLSWRLWDRSTFEKKNRDQKAMEIRLARLYRLESSLGNASEVWHYDLIKDAVSQQRLPTALELLGRFQKTYRRHAA